MPARRSDAVAQHDQQPSAEQQAAAPHRGRPERRRPATSKLAAPKRSKSPRPSPEGQASLTAPKVARPPLPEPTSVAAKPSRPPPTPMARSPFFWTAEKNGQVSYLFGTIHAGVKAPAELPPEVWTTMQQSRCIVLEADQSAINPQALIAMGRLPAGESLPARLPPGVWPRLVTKLDHLMPKPLLETMQPWFAALVLMQTVTPPGTPMDEVFRRRGKDSGKRLVFLEDWRTAMGAFAAVTTAADVAEAVRSGDAPAQEAAALIAAYKSGDVPRLEAMIQAQMSTGVDPAADAAKAETLLYGRNRAWMPRLEAALAKGPCFVAVGVAHLLGRESVRLLLHERGFAVRPVSQQVTH